MEVHALGGLAVTTVTRFRPPSEARRSGERSRETLVVDLPEIAGLELSARHRPAADAVAVSGDFAAAFGFGGAVGIVIGDTVGHGDAAAARSVQLRSALATALHITRDPAGALRVVDARWSARGERCAATAMCLIVDPGVGVATIATAGHPPPLVICSDRTSDWLTLPSGPPVGVPGDRPDSTTVALGPDDIVLCFTDGVIERPGVVLDDGVAHLAGRVIAATRDLHTADDVVEAAMAAAIDVADGRDDALALALRFDRA